MIRNTHPFHLGHLLSFDGKRNGAAVKCAMLMLLAILLAASPYKWQPQRRTLCWSGSES
jgi:hypothetical protein